MMVGNGGAGDRARLAERVSDWIDTLQLDDDAARTTLATALAAALTSAAECRALLDTLLSSRPVASAAEAEQALTTLTELNIHLLGEIRGALDELEAAWPALEDRLIELGPDDDDPA